MRSDSFWLLFQVTGEDLVDGSMYVQNAVSLWNKYPQSVALVQLANNQFGDDARLERSVVVGNSSWRFTVDIGSNVDSDHSDPSFLFNTVRELCE